MFSLTFLPFLSLNLQTAVFSLSFLTFGGPFAIWGADTQAQPDRIAQRPLNVKNGKNVNENIAFWTFEVKNGKNDDENTAFWQVDYEMYCFFLAFP